MFEAILSLTVSFYLNVAARYMYKNIVKTLLTEYLSNVRAFIHNKV